MINSNLDRISDRVRDMANFPIKTSFLFRYHR